METENIKKHYCGQALFDSVKIFIWFTHIIRNISRSSCLFCACFIMLKMRQRTSLLGLFKSTIAAVTLFFLLPICISLIIIKDLLKSNQRYVH